MENTNKINPSLKSISKSALFIEKVHNCAECPIRQMAMKKPHSLFAKIHAWHKTWWPGWQAHQARTCPFAATASMHSQTQTRQ